MTLAQAQAWLAHEGVPAELVGAGSTRLRRVHTDTRTLERGDLFVALKGERFDAHAFLGAARDAGAAAALAEHGVAEAGLPGLVVGDSLRALQALAKAWRARIDIGLIAVAGSNGKTTVTQMIASILRSWLGEEALATQGNFNNHIGVPLTLLRLRDDPSARHRCAVVELGMNHPGEIGALARLAAPTVALVNNAQREHQEFMASVEAVARENGAVIEALPQDGTAVFPADESFAPLWRSLAATRRVMTFAFDPAGIAPGEPADVTARAELQATRWKLRLRTPAGAVTAALRAPGVHNVRNALAATAAALAAGAPLAAVRDGLAAFEPVAGRSREIALPVAAGGATLIDDSYNANPDSVRAAIDLLAAMPAPRWLVLGDMGEVGERGPAFHAEVGAYARERGIDLLWSAGALCTHAAEGFGAAARHFPDVESLVCALGDAPAFASALVKGSRFMRMERVVQALSKAGGRA